MSMTREEVIEFIKGLYEEEHVHPEDITIQTIMTETGCKQDTARRIMKETSDKLGWPILKLKSGGSGAATLVLRQPKVTEN